jgi:chemotaxis receptor (MCP) glutamine deamidase CheD
MSTSIYLMPGQVAVLSEPGEIRTLLGSCVAVALYDPVARVGGLNHFLLPEATDQGPGPQPCRYGDHAMPTLIDGMLRCGALLKHMIAEVYGGAAVVSSLKTGFPIGEANVELACRALEQRGIRIAARDTGGRRGRKVLLNLPDGRVTVRYLTRTQAAEGA